MQVSRLGSLVFALVAPGCLAGPPDVGAGETDESDSDPGSTSAVETETSPSSTSATSVGTTEATSVEESGSSGEPCMLGDPGCAAPGETIWNAVFGGAGNDGAYSMVVEGDAVVVGGEWTMGASNVPWMLSVALDDGAQNWQAMADNGEGGAVTRGIAALGDGRVAGVGTVNETMLGSSTWLDVRDGSGGTIASHSFMPTTVNWLLGAALSNDRLWMTGFASHTSDPQQPFPLLLSYHTVGGSAWTLDYNSVDTGELESFEGATFELAFTGLGDIIAVGYVIGNGQDAAILHFTSDGQLLESLLDIGGDFDDGFTAVAMDPDGSAVAVGRDGTSPTTADVLIYRFSVGDSVVPGEATTWGDGPFTSVNGFARDGDTLFLAAGTSTDPALSGPSFDTAILRWDGDATEPTWVQTYAPDSPGRDYGSDVALAPDDTIVVCGVMTPEGSTEGDAWVRRIAR